MNIKLKNIFLVLTGFQITWLSCVFGEYYEISLFGFSIGILYLLFFFYFKSNKIKALNICIIISLVGYLFDTILGFETAVIAVSDPDKKPEIMIKKIININNKKSVTSIIIVL